MTREEIVPLLEQYIKWKDEVLQEAKNLLERIKAGDDGAIEEASHLWQIKYLRKHAQKNL